MTIKHMKKNISAEDITTVFDIEVEISEKNPNHLEKLILTRKNFYNDETKRNIPDTTNELLNYFYTKYQINENFYTKDEINERIKIHMVFRDSEEDLPEEGQENYIYLIPFEEGENKEGAFKEYVWTGDNEYEQVGSTDLQPILDKFDEYATKEELNNKADSNHTHTAGNIIDSSLNNAMSNNFSEVTSNNKQVLLSIIEKLHSSMLYIESIKEGLSDEDFQSFGSFMDKFGDIADSVEDVYSEIDDAISNHNRNSNAHSDIRAALNNFATKEELDNIINKFGLEKESIDKFNFAVINKVESNLTYEEFWVLINADYDYEEEKFIKLDQGHTSFGIQLQANGTYPGEESIDSTNTGINLWRHPKTADIYKDTNIYNYDDNYIGAEIKSNNQWKTFGISSGWNNIIMFDSYGGATIGGAGIEIDGNGISPFGRLTHSSYAIIDESNITHQYYLFGLIDNGYHPTQWGSWGVDTTTQCSWFIGLKSPQKNGAYLTKDTEQTTFVVMYNDKEDYSSGSIDASKWNILFEVGIDGIKSSIFNDKNIVAEDFQITYDDGSDPEIVSILTLQNDNN